MEPEEQIIWEEYKNIIANFKENYGEMLRQNLLSIARVGNDITKAFRSLSA